MKPSTALLAAIFAGFALNAAAQAPAAAAAPAGPVKIAVINFQAAVAQTNEFQRDFADLTKKFTPKRDQLQATSTEIENLKKQLQSQAATLSDADKASRARAIDDKQKKLQRDAEDAQNDFQQEMQQTYGTVAQKVGQVLIPTEEVVELRNGKKVTSKRLLYPGYVMVQIAMDDELWHQVKNTPRVTGFVGGGNTPVPLSADEVNSILYRQASSAERPRPKLTFEKNETVRITDGPFTNFSGKVEEINNEKNTLRVLVTIFGRSTPVELDFEQVEKIQ